ncbi:MAG: cache domain-containing protein [Gemmatimonadales bacterium]
MLRSIALRLMSGFLVIIVIISAVFSYVGVRFIDSRVVAEAQRRVASDLSAAREMYGAQLLGIEQLVQLTAGRLFLRDALVAGRPRRAATVFGEVPRREHLDLLVLTDGRGRVLLRPGHPGLVGDDRSGDPLVRAVLARREAVAGTSLVGAEELRRERPDLMDRACCARPGAAPGAVVGMLLHAAAPVEDAAGRLIGVVYGGVLLNGRADLVDRIQEAVFQDPPYEGKAVGAATLFLGDTRISTTILNADGTRALGTRIDPGVYHQVVREGRPWVAPTFAVGDWYLAAYAPLADVGGANVGMLGVGILEAPYLALKRHSRLVFLGITLSAAGLTVGLSYLISRSLSVPLRHLVEASRRLAHGELDTAVAVPEVAEFAELAESFNAMATALRMRDEKLHDFARRKIMESERLALIGQLAADVAHELNNPLQGIVTYSHLLREKGPANEAAQGWVDKIIIQADRSTKIIRGLLDFARPRTPLKRPTKVNVLLEECIALVENQAQFHNIEVVKQFRTDVPEVVIDPSLMQQVFLNLIINAAEAMDGGGRLALTTCYDPIARTVEVGFVDTGHGIRPEDVDRVFEPFFTTKEVGHGTGLGLAISFGIVKEHHGAISVESEIGKGTAFIVSLPVDGAGEG